MQDWIDVLSKCSYSVLFSMAFVSVFLLYLLLHWEPREPGFHSTTNFVLRKKWEHRT